MHETLLPSTQHESKSDHRPSRIGHALANRELERMGATLKEHRVYPEQQGPQLREAGIKEFETTVVVPESIQRSLILHHETEKLFGITIPLDKWRGLYGDLHLMAKSALYHLDGLIKRTPPYEDNGKEMKKAAADLALGIELYLEQLAYELAGRNIRPTTHPDYCHKLSESIMSRASSLEACGWGTSQRSNQNDPRHEAVEMVAALKAFAENLVTFEQRW